MHPLADLIAVDHERAERRHHEHRHEVVEKRCPGGDEADSVADHEQARYSTDQCGATDPPDDTDHQRHQDHSEHRAAESPSESAVAEQCFAEGDQVFTDRRMHHQTEAGVVLHAVVVQHLPGLGRVVLLVEDRSARVRGRAEIHQPCHRAQCSHDRRGRPTLEAVGRPEVGDGFGGPWTDDIDRGLCRDALISRGGHVCDRRVWG